MNRRSLFRLLTGAAAAVGLGKVPAEPVKQAIRPFTDFPQFTPTSAALDRILGQNALLRHLEQVRRNEELNAFVDTCWFHHPRGRETATFSFSVFNDPDSWGPAPRQRLLDNLDASRDARLTSRFREGA